MKTNILLGSSVIWGFFSPEVWKNGFILLSLRPVNIAHGDCPPVSLFFLHKIRVLCRKDFLTEENESVVLKDRFFLLPL